MSYPVDPSEVYELRNENQNLQNEIDELHELNSRLEERFQEERRKRKKAERTAKDYADANARALRIVAMLTDGPVLNEIARDRLAALPGAEVTFCGEVKR